jgi:aminoglycoside 3-N-acetyltransferase
MQSLTSRQLANDLLTSCGIQAGDILIVHSSLKSIGQVDGGPTAVIRALLNVIDPAAAGGTLLMPTFSDPRPDGLFDMANTPSRTGLITETFRTWPDARRSRHPTHSVTAYGPRATEFIKGHDSAGPLSAGSPFHLAALAGAKVLMIGCTLTSCSIIHVAEDIVRVPYLGKVFYPGYDRTLTLVDNDGSRKIFEPRDVPGDSDGFDIVERPLRQTGKMRECRLGNARCMLFRALDGLNAAVEILKKNPAGLLCANPRCPVSPAARRHL